MHIKLDVSFPSGAKVELSKGELERVTKFIHGMLFASTEVNIPVKKRKKTKSYVYWTEADKATLTQIASMSQGTAKTRAIRQFSLDSGHSRPSIQTRMYRLKTEKKASTPVFFH